eukprot:scaffold250023_cov62-Attheya_sp.AAC.4
MSNRKAQKGADFPDMWCAKNAASFDGQYPVVLCKTYKVSGRKTKTELKAIAGYEMLTSSDHIGIAHDIKSRLQDHMASSVGHISPSCIRLVE